MTVFGQDYFTNNWVSRIASAVLTSAAAALPSPPATQYVSAGEPAADGCDQLVVWVDKFKTVRPIPGTRGKGAFADNQQSLNPQGALPAVDFKVQLLRCGAPGITSDITPALPTAADLSAFAASQLTDGWALYRGLIAAWAGGTLFGHLEHAPGSVVIGQQTAVGSQGGTAGWQLPVTAGLY